MNLTFWERLYVVHAFLLTAVLSITGGCQRNRAELRQASGAGPSQQLTQEHHTNSPTRETPQQQALRSLSAAMPDAQWDGSSALSADFDSDGLVDQAFLGHARGKVLVGVVRAAAKEPEILEFGVNSSAEDAICKEPAKLAIESLDYDPNQDGGEIEGFERSKQAKGLVLSDDACDPIHIYWNHKTKHIWWWRL